MKLSIREAYLTMFCFLDKFWFSVQEKYQPRKLDDLAVFLGAMNPFLWVGGMSADPAYWEDWKKIIGEMSTDDSVTLEEAFQSMHMFVEFYQTNFLNDLDIAILELQKIKEETKGYFLSWKDWEECASQEHQ